MNLAEENRILRKLLWLNHGCVGLYGDDGEMQCGKCGLDFKRTPAENIRARFQEIAYPKIVEFFRKQKEKESTAVDEESPQK